ncbi:hypothetical protein AB1Y20_002252 [Prymnesium parvum]|uniref:Uncharacterized protein n=1 Tax=Prymnesium parvum TaxID=97485 RepID=A0AB34JAR6_PRYPA
MQASYEARCFDALMDKLASRFLLCVAPPPSKVLNPKRTYTETMQRNLGFFDERVNWREDQRVAAAVKARRRSAVPRSGLSQNCFCPRPNTSAKLVKATASFHSSSGFFNLN